MTMSCRSSFEYGYIRFARRDRCNL